MTKKDYIAIAKIIKENSDYHDPDDGESNTKCITVKTLTNELSKLFAADNPHFNKDKFIKACDY